MEKYIIAIILVATVILSGCTNSTDIKSNTADKADTNNSSDKYCDDGSVCEVNSEEKTASVQYDFESAISGDCWEYIGPADGERGASPTGHSGKAIFIQNQEKNETYWQTTGSCLMDASAGKEYEFKAWIQMEKGEVLAASGKAKFGIDFLGVDGEVISSETSDSVGIGDWEQVNIKESAPAGTHSLRLKLILDGNGMAKFDDLEGFVS